MIFSSFIDRATWKPRSKQWRKTQKEFLAANPACIACGSKEKLEVHHLLPFHINAALENEFSNLATFCRKHHYGIGHGETSWKAWNDQAKADAAGMVMMLRRTRQTLLRQSA